MSDTEYTELDIKQAIDLVKEGCKDVDRIIYENLKISDITRPLLFSSAFFIDSKYKIKTSKLNEWNSNNIVKEGSNA